VETTHDFGKVLEDKSVTHVFSFENTGTGPLEILKVDPDCTCTVPEYDKVIHPGKTGKMTLTLKPYSSLHDFRKETTIKTNDPIQPEVVLVLKGYAEPIIEIQPSHIIKLKGSPGEEVETKLKLISNLPTPWKISYYKASIPDKIDVALKPEEAGKTYELTIKNKFKESGNYSGIIELFSNFKPRPRLIIRVFGDFAAASPAGLSKEPPVKKGAGKL